MATKDGGEGRGGQVHVDDWEATNVELLTCQTYSMPIRGWRGEGK